MPQRDPTQHTIQDGTVLPTPSGPPPSASGKSRSKSGKARFPSGSGKLRPDSSRSKRGAKKGEAKDVGERLRRMAAKRKRRF